MSVYTFIACTTHICIYTYVCVCVYIPYVSVSGPLGEACLLPINMQCRSVVQRRLPGVSEWNWEG